jgi:hypothetical protein
MLKMTHAGLCKVISVGNIWDLFVSIPNMHFIPHVDSLEEMVHIVAICSSKLFFGA